MESILKHLTRVLSICMKHFEISLTLQRGTIIIIVLVKLEVNLKMYIFSKEKFKYS